MNEPARLLAVFAHPDDESFGAGGNLARYAAQGIRAFLVCATRGEAGEISDPALATPETLGQVREQELRNACRVLGINEPIFLGYRDSGMSGTPENQHAASLNQADPQQVVERLTHLLHHLKPQVVITFDAQGGYGHPDHVAIHRHTTAAVAALQPEGTAPRLYYSAIPRSRIRAMIAQAPPESPFSRLNPETVGTPDEAITTEIDVSAYAEVKLRALGCHRTQMPPDGPLSRFPKEMRARFLSTEYFIRIFPPFEGGQRESDLFG